MSTIDWTVKKNRPPLLGDTGDEEQNDRNRLQFLREAEGDGVVYIPQSWVDRNPVMRQAVEELDWLKIEESK